ncbi:MAG TPA: glycosyltransferase, partial [Chitinophagaceae bacterium]|nr:glycosyltransferase [Chitinophagaceae bacterium]
MRNIFSERGNFFKVSSNNDLVLEQQRNKLTESHKTLELHIVQLQTSLEGLKLENSQLRESNMRLKENYETLELTNNKLQKKYQEDIADLSKKIKDTDSSFNNTLDKLSATKKENELFKNYVTWYRNTYENRSILGVLKEKIKSLLKKKLNDKIRGRNHSSKDLNGNTSPEHVAISNSQNLIKRHSYYLNPANDIKLSDDGIYTTTSTDPFFLVDLKNKRLKQGWYWLHVKVTEEEGKMQTPKLYYDCGQGFNEEDIWNLPNANNGKIESLVRFQAKIKQLRFDPTTIECTFTIKEFHLKSISKIKAFQIAALKHGKNHFLYGSYFFVFGKLVSTLFKSGISGINKKINDSISLNERETQAIYTNWCALYDTISENQFDIIKSLSDGLAYQPLFSIIMPVYNAPLNYLKKAIKSVENQAYKNWELCIADDKSTNRNVSRLLQKYQSKDKRIKVIFRKTNGHISNASNSALELATGDYIVLLDQDDELRPHSLYMVAKVINENRKLELVYSDEDKIDEEGNRFDPYFKTDWNKDLFYGQNLICHLGVYKLSLIKKIGGFRPGYEGSQDYDLALRCIEHLKYDQIYHIPHVLYHWRAIKGSTAVIMSNKNYAIDAGIKALKDHLKRTDQKATVEQNINSS